MKHLTFTPLEHILYDLVLCWYVLHIPDLAILDMIGYTPKRNWMESMRPANFPSLSSITNQPKLK